ncbi:hypothetical protein JCM11641_003070 [Rhodosporidiobolus odoratus]
MSTAPQLSTYRSLIAPRGLYSLTLGSVLGTTLWHSFIGGPASLPHLPSASRRIAYTTLARPHFAALQAALFPRFFALQSIASAALLGLYARAGKVSNWKTSLRSDRNVWALAVMLAAGLGNWAVVGPWTTSTMRRRHRREKIEGKEYNDPTVSPQMLSLNSKFAKLHGVSSLLNLAFFLAAAGHAAVVGVEGIL